MDIYVLKFPVYNVLLSSIGFVSFIVSDNALDYLKECIPEIKKGL